MLIKNRPKLLAVRYAINVRWFYLLALFVLSLYLGASEGWLNDDVLGQLLFVFGAVALLNFVYIFYVSYINRRGLAPSVNGLGILQVVTDLLVLGIIMHLAGGVAGIVPLFFFIPIIESVLLFSYIGPVVIALFAGLLINGFVFLVDYDTAQTSIKEALVRANSISVVYLISGLFVAYIGRILKQGSYLLEREAQFKQTELDSLQQLNRQMEENSKILKAKELELTLANQKLETLEQAKSKFVSVTAHQLRTPLAAIKWTFNMIIGGQLGPINEDQRSFLQKGYLSTERIISIVNDLLSIDKIDTEKGEYVFEESQIEELIASLLFEFSNQVESKKIKMVYHQPDKPLPKLTIDVHKIRAVIENLIDNAIKYTPAGGQVEVRLSTEKLNTAQPAIEVIVSDNGPGIPSEDQKKIFQKFFRSAQAVGIEPDGSGLGLYISKDIIEKHGGAIWFVSEVGKGTSFHFTLPLAHKDV
jgi:signal transduction histidine kinase